MSQTIASDHPAVETVRAHVKRHGGGRRLVIPNTAIPAADVVRVVLDGDVRFGGVSRQPASDDVWLTTIRGSPTHARSGSGGQEYLDAWLAAIDHEPGSSVPLDVIESDYAYGLRTAGTRVHYPDIRSPSSSLSSIADSL